MFNDKGILGIMSGTYCVANHKKTRHEEGAMPKTTPETDPRTVNKADIELGKLRISFPRHWPGVIVIGLVLASLLSVLAMLLYGPSERVVFRSGYFERSGKIVSQTNKPRMVQFWTPSVETSNWLEKDKNGKTREDEQWEQVSENKIREFDELLAKMKTVDGYRRYKVYGHGQQSFREGWWWVLTVRNDFQIEDFVKEYSNFWGDNEIYVEQIVSDSRYLTSK
jgi:hypothetical protein